MDGWRTFYRTCIVILTLVGAYLIYELGQILIILFFAVLFASAIRPYVVALMRRGVPQVGAILLIYLLFFVLLFGTLILVVPPLISLTVDFFSNELLVTQINQLLRRLTFLGRREFQIALPSLEIPDYMLTWAAQTAEETAREQALPVAQNTLLILGQIGLAFVMGFYWLTSHSEIQGLLLRIAPLQRRPDVELIWNDVEQTLGAYVRGQAILMAIIGLVSFLGLWALGVPYALALAAIAGLMEVIPVLGPILGAIPAIMVAFTISPPLALVVALYYLVVQQLEGNVLVPKVMQDNVGLNPLLVILTLTAGAALYGIVGAIVAIPLAGVLQVLVKRLLIIPAIERAEDESGLSTPTEGTALPEDPSKPDIVQDPKVGPLSHPEA
jgi:predicted PurR-regulated permease PerM